MIKDILSAFGLCATAEPQQIFGSLTNSTFFIETENGPFIVQKLHSSIPSGALYDMHAVASYLNDCGISAPRLLFAEKNVPYVIDAAGSVWRIYSYTQGRTVHALPSLTAARAAGRFVGNLHKKLQTLDYTLQSSIPHFHDSSYIAKQLADRLDRVPVTLHDLAQHVLAQIENYYISSEKPQIIHGDLKVSNLLFSEDLCEVVGVIDFDTLLERDRLIDLGDAYRSWCNLTREDDPGAAFDMNVFNAVFEGYTSSYGAGEILSEHLRAAKLITLELTARFLIDVVDDSYFHFDASRYATRREHNAARAIGQFHLASTIKI